jgi:hypothetical protein
MVIQIHSSDSLSTLTSLPHNFIHFHTDQNRLTTATAESGSFPLKKKAVYYLRQTVSQRSYVEDEQTLCNIA